MANKKTPIRIALIGILVMLIFGLGYYSNSTDVIKETVVKYDTITIEKIVPDTVRIKEYVIRKVTPLEDVNKDTTINQKDKEEIEVLIPISEYKYSEPNMYDIDITGYEVSLNKVTVYPKTIYKTEYRETKSKPRFGLGLQLGYGISNKGISPYVGIGLQYNIFTF